MIHMSGSDTTTKNKRALDEIDIFVGEGLDGCIIENYHGDTLDVRFVLDVICARPKNLIKIGINILPNDYNLALKWANDYKIDFIQLDYIAGSYGRLNNILKLDVKDFIEVRNTYEHKPKILGGVWPKYYDPIKDSDLTTDINEGLLLADSIVVTGSGTGQQTPIEKIKEFRNIIDGRKPLIIGAGLDSSNVIEQLQYADGGIVGSCFKPYKRTNEMIYKVLVKEFMDKIKEI